jgi:hypothetical protein
MNKRQTHRIRRNHPVRNTQRNPDTTFWNDVYRSLSTVKYRYPYPRRKFTLFQKGGAPNKKKTIMINEHPIEYYEDIENNIKVIKGGGIGKKTCFVMQQFMHKDQMFMNLHEVKRGKHCFADGNGKSKDIVLAAIEIAKREGAHWIELMDDSKICKVELNNDYAVNLSDYCFLTRGKTWYETIAPFIPDKSEKIEKYRTLVLSKSWKDIIDHLQQDYKHECNKILQEIHIDTTIDINAPGSGMKVLHSIPKSSRCVFFDKYIDYFLIGNGIQSLYGHRWYLPLI